MDSSPAAAAAADRRRVDELGPARVQLRWKLINVDGRRDDDDDDDGVVGGYAATFEAQDDDGASVRRTVRARTLVLTIPAHAVGTALYGVLPGSAALLAAADSSGGVPYPPVASVALAYPKSSFLDVDLPDGSGNLRDLPGFGVVSARSAVRTLATLFGSSLFPGRCPDGYNLLSSTIGGTRYAAVGVMSEDDIVAAVDGDLRTMMLIRSEAPPPKVLGVRVWPNAIPQYELGHSDTMAELKRMEDANDVGGLWVCGSYRTGVSLTACVKFGYDHAKVVAGHLTSKRRVREADDKRGTISNAGT
jgi:oxygen-dependent protoporphyrinogen oxidase